MNYRPLPILFMNNATLVQNGVQSVIDTACSSSFSCSLSLLLLLLLFPPISIHIHSYPSKFRDRQKVRDTATHSQKNDTIDYCSWRRRWLLLLTTSHFATTARLCYRHELNIHKSTAVCEGALTKRRQDPNGSPFFILFYFIPRYFSYKKWLHDDDATLINDCVPGNADKKITRAAAANSRMGQTHTSPGVEEWEGTETQYQSRTMKKRGLSFLFTLSTLSLLFPSLLLLPHIIAHR